MPTLYDYLAGLQVDGKSLVWSNKPLSANQIKESQGRPYVRVIELDENVRIPLYGDQDVMGSAVDVLIFQGPDADGSVPTELPIRKLFHEIRDAPKHVDAWTYGQPLIECSRDLALSPKFDDDTGGLRAMVRLRLLYALG